MKINPGSHILTILLGLPLFAAAATPPVIAVTSQPIAVPEVIGMAEQASPDLKAALDREKQAEETVGIIKSFYYPTVDAEAIDSWGFAASNSGLGIQGLMGSPFRSGAAGGLVSKLALVDIGRIYNVRAAHQLSEAAREDTKIVQFRIDQAALQILLEAARFQAQQKAAHEVGMATDEVAREVDRFVRTGQRSVVERLLVQDQTADAAMTEAGFQQRALVGVQRLQLITGSPLTNRALPDTTLLTESDLGLVLPPAAQSPLLTRAAAEAAAAHIAVSAVSAQNYPKVTAMASVGDMSKSRVVEKQDYSGGVGIDLPLFEGGGISDQIHRAEAIASEQDQSLMGVQLQLSDLNAHYDEIINASRVQLEYLQKELEVAQRAFQLGKERYNAFQGTLVDVRESIRNLGRVRAEIIDIKTDFLLAVGSKALLNGGQIMKTR